MNALFHLAAFVLISLLIYWLLVSVRQKRFLQALLQSATLRRHGRETRVYVDEPGKFISNFAQAFALAIDGEPPKGLPPRRIDPVPLVDLCLRHGIKAMEFQRSQTASDAGCTVQFELLSLPSADLTATLSKALGEDLVFHFNAPTSSTHEETSCQSH